MNINTYAGIYVDNEGLFVPTVNFNGLFVITKDFKTEYLGCFIGSTHSLAWTIVASYVVNREIYFFSFYEFCFWKLNLDTKEIEYVNYYTSEYEVTINNVELVNNQFWIFPSSSNVPILSLDCNTNIVSKLNWDCSLNKEGFSTTKTVAYENKIFLVNRKNADAKLLIIDCVTKSISYEAITDALNINALTISDNFLWTLYLHKNGKLALEKLSLLDKFREVIFLEDSIDLLNENDIKYYQLVICKDSMYAFSTVDNHVLEINLTNFQVQKLYNSKLKDIKLSTPEFALQSNQEIKGGYLIYSSNLGYIQLLDITEKKLKTLNYQLDNIEIDKAYKMLLENNTSIFLEKDVADFEHFSKNISDTNIRNHDHANINGENIYHFLMSEFL